MNCIFTMFIIVLVRYEKNTLVDVRDIKNATLTYPEFSRVLISNLFKHSFGKAQDILK